MRREMSRVSFLMCPFCVRGSLLTSATLPHRAPSCGYAPETELKRRLVRPSQVVLSFRQAKCEDAHVQVSEDSRVGTELAGYRIESLLGWGGMSVVYLAEDLRLKRRVALKLLAPSLAEDESFRDRFLRESELAASIDHPNIVPIYEAGTAEDLLFIAMRYVEGRDLKERLHHGCLDPRDATGIVAQVASALDAAHARGLVHRDVKPSNVLLDTGARPDGSDHVYLADFGLTRRVSDESGAGDDGHLMGTTDYVAPEQIAGEETDGRADVYSLGCVLYECLVGQPPFRRDSELAVVFAHLETEPPAPSAHRPGLPAALDAVVARALAKEPEQRYSSCRELARAALTVAVEEASRQLVDVASRAAAGKSGLSKIEAELAGKVTDLQLVREQERALSGPATPARVASEGMCPFKGLASFEPVDADYFFGRERLVAEFVARLVGAGFLDIVGPSGSGKSSVLRAGLLPALAGGVLPGSAGWRRLLLRPGEHPLDELRRVLVSGAKDPLAEALDALPAGARLLLAVDQLEELFTACQSEAERTAFADTLARAAADPDGRAVVVVALRADFYGRFAAYPGLADLLGANQVLVGPMQTAELRRAVELPASRVGLRVEPELVDALVEDVQGEPGALPLLSTALLELWQKRQENTLTLAAYRESGGVHGAVARLAEGTYARIPDERKPIVRAIMLRLVGEGDAQAPVRRRAPLTELDLERSRDVADVLATVADGRLVTVGEGSVEVAHEALLREWPRLREWIEEDAEGRRLRRHITQAASEWDAAGRDQGELYRGARLAAALDWSTDHAFELNQLEREFVTESREASQREVKRARRTNRRLRALLIGVAVLLAATVAGGIFAVRQRGEARDAETAQFAQRLGAQALVEADLDLSLLLARQGVAIDDSPQTRGYLLATLLRAPKALGVMHGQQGILPTIAIDADGKTLAVPVPYLDRLVLFDARTYEQIGKPIEAPYVHAVAYSRDGKTLAYAGVGYLRLVDARTREQLAQTDTPPGGLGAHLAFTDDGSLLVALMVDTKTGASSILFRDARTLEPIGRPFEPEGFTGAFVGSEWRAPHFALTPDGHAVVTASDKGELTWWDLKSLRKTRSLEIATGYHALALSRDGLTAAVGIDHGIELVDVRTGVARTATGGPTGTANYLLFSRDDKTVVSTNLDGTVTLWDVGSATPSETLRGHSAAVQQPVFSPDGRTLYTASHDGTAIAWDIAGDRGLGRVFRFTHDRAFDPAGYGAHPGRLSPDGRLIAVGLEEKGIGLWDAHVLKRVGAPLLATGGEVKALAFSADGRLLAAVTVEGMATLWDRDSRSLRRGPFRVDRLPVIGVNFNADGTMMATAGEGGVKLWDVATGAALGRLGDGSAAGDVAFSPNGSRVAIVREGVLGKGFVEGGGDAEIWDVERRSLVTTLPIHGRVGYAVGSSVAFSPDGRMLATGGLHALVYLWDLEAGTLIRTLDQGVAGGLALEFSADGRILAVSGVEGAASLWDVATGKRIGPRLIAGSRKSLLDLSSEGHRLLITSENGQGAVWDIDPASWAQRACTLANRTLTREEWEEFLPGRPYEPACAA
jgi:WD40 repeat protein/tRNA A-37 threonylcarbamoyl transferase component Bud32